MSMSKYLELIFFYQNPSYLTKQLYDSDQTKNDEIIKNINDGFIELRNAISIKEILENETPEKIVHIVDKFIGFK